MPRSSLLNALMRIAADVDRAQRAAGSVDWGPKIERRAVFRGAASLAGMALLPRLPALAAAEARVAIVGAGLAGLTAAYELSKSGLRPVVYEGSTRLGGRCLSIKFLDGQIAEQGGEFINSYGHDAIMNLAFEFHLMLDDAYDEKNNYHELWSFDGDYSQQQATDDYKCLAPEIKRQFREIDGYRCNYKFGLAGEDHNPCAIDLDGMSLANWLKEYVPKGGRASKLGQLIENALTEELAADATRLSGLWPAWLLHANNAGDEFKLCETVSDERYHIRGGNDQIPALLGEKLGDAVQTGTALTAVITCEKDGNVKLVLTRDSKVFEEFYDRVILALPFTTLRQIDIKRAKFSELKLRAIETLEMGASTKLHLRFKNREVWHNDKLCCDGAIRLQSDLFQTTWDVSSGHRHDRGKGGMLCFWSGGSQAERAGATRDCQKLANDCLNDAEKVLRPLTDGTRLSDFWTGEVTRAVWRSNPWSLGSYSHPPIGYLTTVFGIEKEPEPHFGPLETPLIYFAGEHTADQAYECGYLNTAVKTGQRAAKEVINSLTRWPDPVSECLPRYRCESPY